MCQLDMYAQWYQPEKVNKKAALIYEGAYNDAEAGNYANAKKKLNDALKLDPRFVDVYLTRAGIFAEEKKYDSSVMNFEQAFQLDSVYSRGYLLPYSISLSGTGEFEQALRAINQLLSKPELNLQSVKAANYRKSVYEFAVDFNKKNPRNDYVFIPKNMGDSINSIYPEYYPSLTIDGEKIIFTRRLSPDEDFFQSNKLDTNWSESKPLEGKVNTNFNEGAQNISQDGNWIVFTGCNYPEGLGSCDLYISYKTNNGFSEAVNLGRGINSENWESAPSLSPDKRDLYFSSNRTGGYGGKDIWVSHRDEKGRWSVPENLGPTINTKGDEGCPFMYTDNETLFFNSTGHMGYGATDLFYAKKTPTNGWDVPVNLGYPINTIDDEGSMVVAADGKTAYYASERQDTRGALDLYNFELPSQMQPPPTLWVKGRVFDAITGKILPSVVELTDIHTRKLINSIQTDEDGNYLTTLPIGRTYAFNVKRKGYLFFSEHYEVGKNGIESAFVKDIPLQPIVPGAKIVLKNIFYETNKTNLDSNSMIELNKIIELMGENPALKIMIGGHTDNAGNAKENLLLSEGRALSVVKYLLASQRIAKERILSKGFGASKPIADNKLEEGRAQNRRTELSVISN